MSDSISVDDIRKMYDQIKTKYKKFADKILISYLVNGIYQVKYKEKIYIIMDHGAWGEVRYRTKKSIPDPVSFNTGSYNETLYGVDVWEDEELVQEILDSVQKKIFEELNSNFIEPINKEIKSDAEDRLATILKEFEEDLISQRAKYLEACARQYDEYADKLRKIMYGDPDSDQKSISILSDDPKS